MQQESSCYYNLAACIIQCTPDHTGSPPDVWESRFSVAGERLLVKAQVLYQRRLTLGTRALGTQGRNLSSHSVTLSLSFLVFIFHSVSPVTFLILSPFLGHIGQNHLQRERHSASTDARQHLRRSSIKDFTEQPVAHLNIYDITFRSFCGIT